MTFAILADDLTGASDTGAQFARQGKSMQVIFDWAGLSSESSDSIVIDTDSRSLSGEQAYIRVKEASAALKKQGYTMIYKKIDSTLRGNVGQEIDAVLDAYDFEAAILVPAFPRIGRTTIGGVHYLHGVPIHETEISRDPKTPVPESDVGQLLALQSGRKCASIHLTTLRSGVEAMRSRIQEAIDDRAQLIVIDAETDQDMKRIAELVDFYANRFLWAGSAGLAQFLIAKDPNNIERNYLQVSKESRSVLLVAGSASNVTRKQTAVVNSQPGVTAIEMDPFALFQTPDRRGIEEERCFQGLANALSKGGDVTLYVDSSSEKIRLTQEQGSRFGMESGDVSDRIAEALGKVAGRAVKKYSLKGVILTGGDTAKAVCRLLGVKGIRVVGELEHGIPIGHLLGADDLMVVTKAGAFGDDHSLLHAMQTLKGERAIV
jgi:uncharacterized protein YgbK (DUF1537 family)